MNQAIRLDVDLEYASTMLGCSKKDKFVLTLSSNKEFAMRVTVGDLADIIADLSEKKDPRIERVAPREIDQRVIEWRDG
jgi:hypothetical protein